VGVSTTATGTVAYRSVYDGLGVMADQDVNRHINPAGPPAVDRGPTAFVDFDREITGAEEGFWGHRVECPEAANGTGAHKRAQFEVNNISSRGEI
jgi:hypothetical protein